MPGTHERHQAKAGSGLRNFMFPVFGNTGDDDYFAAALTGSPLTSLAVGDKLTLTGTGMPLPRAVTSKVVTDATVATRAITLRFHGENQFGDYITEDLTTSNAASQTRVGLGAKVFAKVTVIEVIAVSGFVTGDNVKVGLDIDVSGQLDPEDVTYGIPVKVLEDADIRGATLLTAGATSAAVDGSNVTRVPGVHGVKLPASAAPDSGNDRLVYIHGRTSL